MAPPDKDDEIDQGHRLIAVVVLVLGAGEVFRGDIEAGDRACESVYGNVVDISAGEVGLVSVSLEIRRVPDLDRRIAASFDLRRSVGDLVAHVAGFEFCYGRLDGFKVVIR